MTEKEPSMTHITSAKEISEKAGPPKIVDPEAEICSILKEANADSGKLDVAVSKILMVTGLRKIPHSLMVENGTKPDYMNFSGAVLRCAKLKNVVLSGHRVVKADLIEADLIHARYCSKQAFHEALLGTAGNWIIGKLKGNEHTKFEGILIDCRMTRIIPVTDNKYDLAEAVLREVVIRNVEYSSNNIIH